MNLRTNYLGLDLANPLVVSAGPVSRSVDSVRALEDAGASAVVVYSLFEEQINREIHEVDVFLRQGTESFAESLSYLPEPDVFQFDADGYVEHIRRLKEAVQIPIIGSLNGVSAGGWTRYARYIEEAGADALELNVYFLPTDPKMTPGEVELNYIDVLSEVKKAVKIPVAVKLSPFFSSLAYTGRRLVEAGANGLVLFNRFYQPDLDVERLEVVPSIDLSSSLDLRLPLRWVAILHGRIETSFALSGGVHTEIDMLKGLMAGADVTMMLAAILKHGPRHVAVVLERLARWLEEHEYESVAQLKGSMSQRSVSEPGLFERANYMKALATFLPV